MKMYMVLSEKWLCEAVFLYYTYSLRSFPVFRNVSAVI